MNHFLPAGNCVSDETSRGEDPNELVLMVRCDALALVPVGA